MSMARWIDHGVTPPAPLPDDMEAKLTYLAHALGHVCYERWTLTRMKRAFPSFGEAKAAKPAVFRLLLDHAEAVEWWERGRIRVAPAVDAPAPDVVLERLLHAHRRRFKRADAAVPTALPHAKGAQDWLATIEVERTGTLVAWLAQGGRFVNRNAGTNTLAVTDDAQATAMFLRDRASRSRHTLRAYAAELRKLIDWCRDRQLGPLSDLARNDLLAYRDALRTARENATKNGRQRAAVPSERTQARALAVVASLYQYWFDMGYLIANPASGLVSTVQAHASFAPQRFLPTDMLAACDAWMGMAASQDDITVARRRAVWALYRYAGVRLAELAWAIDTGLPRIEAEDTERWTLYVRGKGNKPRAIPLPAVAIAPLRTYRLARGLPAEPAAHEALPLIHGFKGGSLQEAGLYAEVKAIFDAVADGFQAGDPARAVLLRAASPHWLRHAYAKALVVDHQAPLPVAQALLGHASVQTTAAYAKTDLSQLRAFVEASFTGGSK